MCEYCGCQEIAAIAQLTREHDDIRELVRTARVAIADDDAKAAAAIAQQMTRALAPHVAVEENGLFAVMAPEFGEHVAGLVAEHRSIETIIAEIAAGPARYDWASRLNAALNDLSEHILKEQDGLFPAALATLSTADWDAVDAARESVVSLANPVRRSEPTLRQYGPRSIAM